MRGIDKGVTDASGKLVIYIMKIFYFNHRASFLSNNFVGIAKKRDPDPGKLDNSVEAQGRMVRAFISELINSGRGG